MRDQFFIGVSILFVVLVVVGLRAVNDSLEDGGILSRFLLSQVSPGPNQALYFVSPSSGAHTVNDTFQVELRIGASTGITSLKAYLDYDPSLIAVTNMTTSLSAFSNWWEDTFDNVAGKLRFQASTPSPGFSGNDGLIAQITFQVMGAGTGNLTYDATSLALKPDDSNILNIAGSTAGTYTLAAPAPPSPTPPSRSNGSPNTALPSGTTSTAISLTTDENATCKFATSAGVSFATMPNTFSSTGGTAHSTMVSGLSDGNTFSYFVRCQDTAGNANTADFLIEFNVAEVGAPGDSTPPSRSNGQPTAALNAGITSTSISLATDESATCRYSATAGVAFSAMTNMFSTTGNVSHSTGVSGLSDGNTYTFYVRCQDGAGNANTTDFSIEFIVASTPPPSPPPPSGGGGGGSGGGGALGVRKGDCNNDKKVNIFDLSILLSNWQKATNTCNLNGDGVINIFDLSILLSNWLP